MSENIYIPLSMDWSKEEIVDVVNFYEAVDRAYHKGVDRDLLLALYGKFKEVVPSKSEEKQYFKEYEEQTNQSPFHTVKKAREGDSPSIIKMG
ncbi:MAG: UPF0223 family protein [Bacillus sp. (in: Bacteria)]|nr:UPF0223 family protein [Bacillus sp. (in: firmicutes)]